METTLYIRKIIETFPPLPPPLLFEVLLPSGSRAQKVQVLCLLRFIFHLFKHNRAGNGMLMQLFSASCSIRLTTDGPFTARSITYYTAGFKMTGAFSHST